MNKFELDKNLESFGLYKKIIMCFAVISIKINERYFY